MYLAGFITQPRLYIQRYTIVFSGYDDVCDRAIRQKNSINIKNTLVVFFEHITNYEFCDSRTDLLPLNSLYIEKNILMLQSRKIHTGKNSSEYLCSYHLIDICIRTGIVASRKTCVLKKVIALAFKFHNAKLRHIHRPTSTPHYHCCYN